MVIKIRLNKWLHIWNQFKSVIFNFVSENNFSAVSSQEEQKQGIRAIKCLGNACTAKKLRKLKPVVQDLYWFPTEFQLLHFGFWPAHQNFTQWQAFCFLFNIILNTKSKNYLLSRSTNISCSLLFSLEQLHRMLELHGGCALRPAWPRTHTKGSTLSCRKGRSETCATSLGAAGQHRLPGQSLAVILAGHFPGGMPKKETQGSLTFLPASEGPFH